jgi:hypothetical protein
MTEPDRISELEKAAHKKDINVSHIVRLYRDRFADQPLLHLIQDINQRVGIYSNILEEIKRVVPGDEDVDAQFVEESGNCGCIPRDWAQKAETIGSARLLRGQYDRRCDGTASSAQEYYEVASPHELTEAL